jgi:hypothetical protein
MFDHRNPEKGPHVPVRNESKMKELQDVPCKGGHTDEQEGVIYIMYKALTVHGRRKGRSSRN